MAIHDVAADLTADASTSAAMYADWALGAGLTPDASVSALLSASWSVGAGLTPDASVSALLSASWSVGAGLTPDASVSALLSASWSVGAGLDGNTAGNADIDEADANLAAAMSGDASMTAALMKIRMLEADLVGDATVYSNISHFRPAGAIDFVPRRPPTRVVSAPAPTHHLIVTPPRRR